MPLSKDPETYKHQMKKVKDAVDKRITAANKEKGLLIVHTGSGKGKSTAAIGMLVRSLGHGYKCAVVQFIKGSHDSAETHLFEAARAMGGSLSWERCGEGFTWNTQDYGRDMAHAKEGWEIVMRHLADPKLRFLFLDELNIILSHKLLDTREVISAIQARHPGMHVVLTGRGASEELINAADMVTEMREIKHPFKAGIKAQPGIEF